MNYYYYLDHNNKLRPFLFTTVELSFCDRYIVLVMNPDKSDTISIKLIVKMLGF